MKVPSVAAINDLEIPIPDSFQGYNSFGELQTYDRNLPHWRQPEATYFVTFRTCDSLPKRVHHDMQEEAKEWREKLDTARKHHSGTIPESLLTEFRIFQRRTQAKLERLLDDCHGACLLKKSGNLRLVADSLRHFNGDRYDLFAAVIMPNHCHVVVRPRAEFELESILASWKSFTARRMEGREEGETAFWQSESFDRIIRDEAHYRKSVRYILKNPVKAGVAFGDCWLFALGVDHPGIHES